MKAIDAQRRVDAEFERGLARVEREARQEAEFLRRDEATADSEAITVADLRRLRSEIDGRKTRLDAIDARIRYANDQILHLTASIAALKHTNTAEPTTLEEVVHNVELRRLEDLQRLVANSIERLNRARAAILRRLAILEERTALARSHARMTSFDEATELADDPRVAALQEIVGRLGDDSIRLGNQAADLTAPELGARRSLLEMQADRTFLRSNLRAGDIEFLGIEAHVEFLRAILAEPSVPTRLLKEARAVLVSLSERINNRLSTIAGARRQLTEQDALVPSFATDLVPQVNNLSTVGDQIRTLAGDQEAAIRRLDKTIAGLQQSFADRVRNVESAALYQRHPLPVGGEAWEHARNGLALLPVRIGEGVRRAAAGVTESVSNATRLRLAAAGLLAAALGLLALWARWALRHSLLQRGLVGSLIPLATAIHGSLLALVPAVAWFAAAKILGVPGSSILLVFGVLAVWPIVAFVLALTRRLLFPDAASAQSGVRRRFYRRLTWASILGGVVAGLVIITYTVALTPGVADLVGRAAMLGLLLSIVPALLLPQLILTLWRESRGEPPFRIQLAAGLSIMMPALLASTALLGLAGYLNLAWSVIGLVVWLLMIGGVWCLLFGVLRSGAARLRRRYTEGQADQENFWIVDFFDPAHRLLQLGLTFLAGWLLFRIYGWTAETPGVSHLLAFGRTPLISLGQSTLTVQNIAIAIVLVVVAFWIGGWSRHVSYNLALVRIQDLGIRHSLSIFVQYVVTVLGLLLALMLIGFDLTALTVFAASLGIGIGFGLQNVVNNFISGILLLAERPLRVGDRVTIGSATGDVTRIGIRSLTMLTFEKKEVIIPNSAVISESFTNWTKTDDTLREVLMLRISLSDLDNAEHAAELVAEVARSTDGLLASPPPKATIYELTDIGISIRLQYFIHAKGPDWEIRDNILCNALEVLAKEGFTIPTVEIVEKPLRHLEPPSTNVQTYPPGSGTRSATRSTA
jgi:potassium efflux system protein